MKKILAVIFIGFIIFAGCGDDSTRGYSSDPNEFPTDLQALENGATIEEASAIADLKTEDDIESIETEENVDENDSSLDETEEESDSNDSAMNDAPDNENVEEKPEVIITLVLNTNSMKAHCPDCSSVDDIKPTNRQDYTGTVEDVIAMGYEACQRCHPF